MFIGHFANGLAFNTRAQGGKITFFLLVLGTQFVDLLWGLFIILGFEGGFTGGSVEHNYFDIPLSHSLLMMFVWSAIYGYATNYYVKRNISDLDNFGLIAGLSVFSHWILDFIVHNDDMRILPNNELTIPSLYLWEYPTATFIVELVIIIGSWEYYLKGLKTEQGADFSRKRPLIIMGLLSLLHVVNFLPSFSDADGTNANTFTGIMVIVLIIIIVALITKIHPNLKKESD